MDFSLDIEIAKHNLQTLELSKRVLPVPNKNSIYVSCFSDIHKLNNCIKNCNPPIKVNEAEMLIYRF